MVCLVQKHCFVCDKDYQDNLHKSTGCPHCAAVKEEAARKAYFDELDKLPMEERIRKIEEWIYDHKRVRHGYIPPPKYA